MTLMAVDFYVKDAHGSPIVGALLKAFNQAGSLPLAEVTTDNRGVASFLLDSGVSYQIRTFRVATSFQNPTYVTVSDTERNTFQLVGHSLDVQTPTDARFCTCYGYFRTSTGIPAAGALVHLTPKFKPILLDGTWITSERVSTHADAQGWVQISLIRFGEYDVCLEGSEDTVRTISIPDAPTCALPTLLFEVAAAIHAPALLQIPLGTAVDLVPEVVTTTGRTLQGCAPGDVRWRLADPNVATMTVLWDKITIYGNSLGATTLEATRYDTSMVRIPDPPLFAGTVIQVT